MYSKILERKVKNKDFFMSLIAGELKNKKISFVNPFSYKVICNNDDVINEVDYWFSDGILLTLLMNFFNSSKIDRVSFDFSSIAHDFFSYAELFGLNLAIIGAKDNEITKAVDYIRQQYPKLKVAYYRDGYFDINDEDVFNNMKSLGVEVLLVGMGTPYQEQFIIEASKRMDSILSITCGGFLTQTAMSGDYYHPLVKKFGLRWLQRAILHKHVRKRLLHDYPIFIFSYIFSRLHSKIFGN